MIVVYITAQTGFGELSLSLGMGGYQRCGAQAPAEHARVAVLAPWKLPSSLELHWTARRDLGCARGEPLSAGIKQLQVQFSAQTPEAVGKTGWP